MMSFWLGAVFIQVLKAKLSLYEYIVVLYLITYMQIYKKPTYGFHFTVVNSIYNTSEQLLT